MRYGMPYQGSKNKIAKWIIENIPKKQNLYDLMGGGGAITHCALEYMKFERVYYNELDPLTFKAFDMATHGLFENEKRWISHDEFMDKRNTDPYVAICFSFGNNRKDYCYSKDKEPVKKKLHNQRVFNQVNDSKQRLQSLESLQRLQRLQELSNIDNTKLNLTNKDYADIEIKDNSVIYCDPPYSNTRGYKIKFDNERFYSWCRKQKELVIISEYNMPDDFICVAQKDRTVLCNQTNKYKETATEKLFVPKHQYQMYLDAMAVLS